VEQTPKKRIPGQNTLMGRVLNRKGGESGQVSREFWRDEDRGRREGESSLLSANDRTANTA